MRRFSRESASRRPRKPARRGWQTALWVVAAPVLVAAAWWLTAPAPGLAAAETGFAPPFAQFDVGGGPPARHAMEWKLPLRIFLVFVVASIIFLIFYFVVYPSALRREPNPPWPLTLFGRCTAAAWFLGWMIVLIAFWKELVIRDEFGGTTFIGEHGLRVAVVGIALGFAVVWWFVWKSDIPDEAKPQKPSR